MGKNDYVPLDDSGVSSSTKKFRLAAALTAIILVFGGVALAVYFTVDSNNEPKSNMIWEEITVTDVTVHLSAFQDIAMNTTGKNRAAGTVGFERSVHYVRDQLEATKFFDVTVQPFEAGSYSVGVSKLSVLSPVPVNLVQGSSAQFQVITNSKVGSVNGTLSLAKNNGCDTADYTATPGIVLVEGGNTNCTITMAVDTAVKANATAVLLLGKDGKSFTGTYGEARGMQTSGIPVVGVAGDVGALLRVANTQVLLEVNADSKKFVTWNVIAQTKTGDENAVIVVGSHLDSVPAGPGINDDGSGSASNLAVALAAAEKKLKFVSQTRFCFWAAEELGLLGSKHYVSSLNQTEFDKLLLNLNFDMLGSINYKRMVNQINPNSTTVHKDTMIASELIEHLFTGFFDQLNLPHAPAEIDVPGRSDYAPFLDRMIPSGGLFTGAEVLKTAKEAEKFGGLQGAQLDPCYHQACDTWPANIDTDVLFSNVRALAYSMEKLATHANARKWLYPNGNGTTINHNASGNEVADLKFFSLE